MSSRKLLIERAEWTALSKEWDFQRNSSPQEYGSNGKAWWICSNNHNYEAEISNRLAGKGCAKCRSLVVNYEDSIEHNYPELAKMFSSGNGKTKKADNSSIFTKKRWEWQDDLGHVWNATVDAASREGCPFCSGRRFLKGFNSIFITHPHLEREWDPSNSKNPNDLFWKSQETANWICSECDCKFTSKISYRATLYSRCPACAGNRPIPGLTDIVGYAPELMSEFDYDSNELSPSSYMKTNYVYWKCAKGHSYRTSARARKLGFGFCDVCRPYIRSSKPERDLADAIESMGLEIVRNTRKIIKPYELDIFIPSRMLAIEFNGSYWHNEANIKLRGFDSPEEYHSMKIKRCEEMGIHLLFVEEQEWRENLEATLNEAKFFAAGWRYL